MPARSTAKTVWEGDLARGGGTTTADSGAFSTVEVSWGSRTSRAAGKTSPEELLAAAHAGCFSMALSKQLEDAGLRAESINTNAAVRLEKTDAGFTITKVHLDVAARVPGANAAAFRKAAEGAKAGCPVSRLFKAEITMEAKLEG